MNITTNNIQQYLDRLNIKELNEMQLQTMQTATSGQNDPRLLALKVEAFLALDRKPEAMMVLPALWKTGYQDLGFIALLKKEKIATPNRP